MAIYKNIKYSDTPISEDTRIGEISGEIGSSFFHSFRLGRYAVKSDYATTICPRQKIRFINGNLIRGVIPEFEVNDYVGQYAGFQYNTLLYVPQDLSSSPAYKKIETDNNFIVATSNAGGVYYNNSYNSGLNNAYRVTDWVYDKVALGIYVRRISVDGSWGGNNDLLSLKEFYDDPTQLPLTGDYLGYIIIYEPIGYTSGFSQYPDTVNRKGLFVGSPFRVGDLSIEVNIPNNESGWIKQTPTNSYMILMSDLVVGGQNFRITSGGADVVSGAIRVGPQDIEGLNLIGATDIDYNFEPNFVITGNYLNAKKRIYYLVNNFWENYTIDDIAQMALSMGLPVLTSSAAQTDFYWNESCQNIVESSNEDIYNYIYFPKISNGQIDREEYYRGKDIQNSPLYQAALVQKEKSISDEDFTTVTDLIGEVPDPSEIDTNTYVTEIELNEPTVTPVGIFSRWYALTEYDTLDLFRFLFVDRTTTQGTAQFNEIVEGLKLMGENPMDFIISLRMYPFSLNDYVDLDNDIEIGFGNGVNTGVVAEKINFASVVLDCGKVKFPKYHKNFLDYSPYTDAKLYIPYCGEVSIDTSVYVGAEINVKMIVDLTTGMCCAVVYKDGIPAIYKDGHIGMDIQMTGTDSYALATAHIGQIAGAVQGAISAGVGAKSASSGITSYSDTHSMGAPSLNVKHNEWVFPQSESTTTTTSRAPLKGSLQALGGVGTMIENAFEYHNTPTPLQISGVNSAVTELFKPQYCYLIIQQSVPMDIPNYGNSYGYACMEYRTINSFSDGDLIACKNCNITPPTATLPEISEIKQLLESGVWK